MTFLTPELLAALEAHAKRASKDGPEMRITIVVLRELVRVARLHLPKEHAKTKESPRHD